MFAKLAIMCTLAAAALASAISPGYLSSAYALGSQAEHTVHGYGGLTSISKQAKAVDSAYATIRKSDIRVTNDATAYAHPQAVTYTTHGHHAYAAPALAQGFAPANIAQGYHAPAGTFTYARQGYAPATLAHHGYATGPTATLAHHGYPTTTLAHHGYPTTTLAHHGYPTTTLAHHGYPTATLSHHGYPTGRLGYTTQGSTISTRPVVQKPVAVSVPTGGLGISYSPATSVAHSTFSGYGVHYGY